MSNEYWTNPAIPFEGLDKELAKYGIGSCKVSSTGMTLFGAHGAIYAQMDQGCADFTNACGDVSDVFEAIELVFDTSVVNEDDRQEHFCSGRSAAVAPNAVLIEGPPTDDPQSACAWAERAHEVDLALQAHYASGYAACEENDTALPARLSSCSLYCMARWFARQGVFHVNMRYSQHTATIRIMIEVGFLQKMGVRYQMALPDETDARAVAKTIVELRRHRPIIPPVVMYREDAEALARSIRAVPRQAHPSLRNLPTGVVADAHISPSSTVDAQRSEGDR